MTLRDCNTGGKRFSAWSQAADKTVPARCLPLYVPGIDRARTPPVEPRTSTARGGAARHASPFALDHPS